MDTAGTLRASLLASDGAHILRSLVEDLARKWTSNVHRCEDSSAVFDTLRDIVAGAISNVAREWNSGHDVLRALPAEVQEQCFESLPMPDRCRLFTICSRWSTHVANLPGIWTRLELGNSVWQQVPAPGALLARSGQLPLDVSLKPHFDMVECDDALRAHSTRLRKLEMREVYHLDVALEFPAPHLEELSITRALSSTVSPMLFDGHAPRLRTLRLTSMSMPVACPAFRSVTTLALHGIRGALDHLFEWMPSLQILIISSPFHLTNLPTVPRHSALRVLRLFNVFVTVGQLVLLGYSELYSLSVVTTNSNTSQFSDAMLRWPALATILRMRANWDFETVLRRPDGRRMRFGVRLYHFQMSTQSPRAFDHIQCLVLPASLRAVPPSISADSGRSRPTSTLLSRNDVVVLPVLRRLVIECSSICDAAGGHPLRDCVLGVFEVPRLARIKVLRAIEVPRAVPVEPVDAADLLALVETILVCDDRASLEVFVDTASGISLIGDVDRLRACVGRLVI